MKDTSFSRFIRERGSTLSEAAEVLGVARSSITNKSAGYRQWKTDEIRKLAEHYGMTKEEIFDVFIR